MALIEIDFIIDFPQGMKNKELIENILTAAYYGDLEALRRATVEYPQSINFTDKFSGGTALHISAGLGNYSCVEFLLKANGVDAFQKDNDGNDALARAYEIGHYAICDLLADKMYPHRHNKSVPEPAI